MAAACACAATAAACRLPLRLLRHGRRLRLRRHGRRLPLLLLRHGRRLRLLRHGRRLPLRLLRHGRRPNYANEVKIQMAWATGLGTPGDEHRRARSPALARASARPWSRQGCTAMRSDSVWAIGRESPGSAHLAP
ncbi:Os02g0563300 [Oryza sativa Japonica Group]|uniref:Os02g0563300 protein n=1 Tax=Oryza sativa subsp. japonica TaxID=39947 RepID=A0A0P0VKQ2_ORYSJ|nr:Os02g0563300 [Oryza sativa Japonica Group]